MRFFDPKVLVYGELHFVSTAVGKAHPSNCMNMVFDEVSKEMYSLFVGGTPVERPVSKPILT